MRKLSLDMTWTECLRMWKWISRQCLNPNHLDVDTLKKIWLQKNGYQPTDDKEVNCFFCYRAGATLVHGADCTKCPGRSVDEDFDCSNGNCSYWQEPREFYQELCRLHEIYLKNKH